MVDNVLEIIAAIGSQKFYKPIEVYTVANGIDEIGVSMIFLVVTFFCEAIIKRKGTFS